MKRLLLRFKSLPGGYIRRLPLPMVILCVDDDHTALTVRRLLLSIAGYTVLTASSVEAALGLFDVNRIDLVITDHFLTDGTGAELTRLMRRLKPEIPLVLLTGLADLPPLYKHIDMVVSKGITPENFLGQIARLLLSSGRNIA